MKIGPDEKENEFEIQDIYVGIDSEIIYDTDGEQHCNAIVEENK